MEKFSLRPVFEAHQSINEETEELYEAVVEFLTNEGLVETYEEADELINLMSDDELDFVLSEARVPLRIRVAKLIRGRRPIGLRKTVADALMTSEIQHPISRKPDTKRRFSGKAAIPVHLSNQP